MKRELSLYECRLAHTPDKFATPTLELTDTMESLILWFDDHDIEPTAGALVAGAANILGRVQDDE